VGSENVEIVRRLYECFAAKDNDTAFGFYAEDIVWDVRATGFPGLDHVYHGHDGVRSFWQQWLEAWDEIEFETGEPIELDDGRVQVWVRQRNRGRGTGIWIDQDPFHQFWTLVDGKVTHVEFRWAGRG
jgi:ketosteroid isomerase-like protein